MTNLRKVYESSLARRRVQDEKVVSLEKVLREHSRIGVFLIQFFRMCVAVSNRLNDVTLKQQRIKISQQHEKNEQPNAANIDVGSNICALPTNDGCSRNSQDLAEEVVRINDDESQKSKDKRMEILHRRFIHDDPELARLRMKREAMRVQQIQIRQMAEVHERILAEKECNKLTDQEALARLDGQFSRSAADRLKLAITQQADKKELIRQMTDKIKTKNDLYDAEVMSDRDNIRRLIEQEVQNKSERHEQELAKRIQVREDYQRFIEERRRQLENDAKAEADRISLENGYMKKLSEREETLARIKRTSEIERNRIKSAITQRVDDASNTRAKHEELVNQLHMERIAVRDEQSRKKKEREKLDERLNLLEEYRNHKIHEYQRDFERKKDSEQMRNHERSEYLKYEASQSDKKTQKLMSRKALHEDLDSLLDDKRKEFITERERQMRADSDRDLIRKLENDLLETEKAQILNDIKNLTVLV
jgi:hypothetical protein